MLLLLAAALPSLLWDHDVDTAQQLRDAGIVQISVPTARLEAWKRIDRMSVTAADLKDAVKLTTPGVKPRPNQASASRDPWIDSNGWQFLRHSKGQFLYDAPDKTAALAAAEAFCYGADAAIQTNSAGLKPLAQMLDFLRTLSTDQLSPVADIGFVDDGSATAGEVMNLMVRGNLLFRIIPAPDRDLKLSVKLGSKDYPAESPNLIVHRIRTNLTDDRRSVRIYGSSVVIGRLTGSGGRLRLHLLNYAAASRPVSGIRVRVLGRYPYHASVTELLDYSAEADATEFTVREFNTYAVIDLSR